jgi:ABC-type transport system involved in multi-copper enzyme maturation permease subunit
MNARIIKETKSLLPVFCVMVLASIAPRFFWSRETAAGVGLGIFTTCCLILGASCFGNEYQWRTMPLLLAQPAPRRKIWNEKMLVLGTVLGLGLILFWLYVPLPERDSYFFLVLVPFCVFSTAPYMALRIKNTLMAAVLTFGLPFGICGLLTLLTWMFSRIFPAAAQSLETSIADHVNAYTGTAAALYCGIYYWLGYRAFVKLEAIDAQAKEMALPAGLEAALAGPLNRLLPRYGGPWASLLRKELQIQKAAFVLAAVMCLVSVLMALAWDVDHAELLTAMATVPIAVLVFIIPMITPGGCVAEERSWGVSDWQRALPVRARKQWAAKMIVVVFTSVLLGVVVPVMLWVLDGWVFQIQNGAKSLHFDAPATAEELTIILYCVIGYVLVLGLGVFTSSLFANSAKAVLTNLGLLIVSGGLAIAAFGAVVAGFYPDYMATHDAHHGLFSPDPPPMVLFVFFLRQFSGQSALGLLFVALLGWVQYLAFSNYRNGEPGSRRAWMQLAIVVGLIVAGVTVFAAFSERYAAGHVASFGELN